MLELLEKTGMVSKRVSTTKGGEHSSPCPGCGGKDRFRTWPALNNGNGAYWCRGCGRSGDNVQFCIDFLDMNFKAASEYCSRSDLLDKYGKSSGYVPSRPLYIQRETNHNSSWQPHEFPDPSEAWIYKSGIFVERCHEALLEKPEIIKWLSKRGISGDVVNKFMLGWNNGDAGQDIYRSRIQWGLPLEKNQTGKLKPLWLPVGLVIPYIKENKVVRIRIRRNKRARKGFDIKYYALPGSYMGPMVLHPDRSCFVITESELDAIACVAVAGDIAGAVGLGNASTRPDPATTNLLKNALQILVALDADTQGGKDMKWWASNFENSDSWPVRIGKDPGEACRQGEDLKEWIKAGAALCPAMIVKMENRGELIRPGVKKESKNFYPIRSENLTNELFELHGLMASAPVQIVHDTSNYGIRWLQSDWSRKHELKAKRISQLVFSEPCMTYIEQHPDKVISYKNFFNKVV